MGFKVIRVLDDEIRGNDGDERFSGQIAGLFPGKCLEIGFEVVILIVFGTYIGVDGACFLHFKISEAHRRKLLPGILFVTSP